MVLSGKPENQAYAYAQRNVHEKTKKKNMHTDGSTELCTELGPYAQAHVVSISFPLVLMSVCVQV